MHSSLGSGKKMTERIRGVLLPAVTPFKADLFPDRQRFIAHCKWLLSQNCELAVFGTNSEARWLTKNLTHT
jgi:4-hydroxy-tetrahydrodipicolinate synthase